MKCDHVSLENSIIDMSLLAPRDTSCALLFIFPKHAIVEQEYFGTHKWEKEGKGVEKNLFTKDLDELSATRFLTWSQNTKQF
jgi:hypothetical protein